LNQTFGYKKAWLLARSQAFLYPKVWFNNLMREATVYAPASQAALINR